MESPGEDSAEESKGLGFDSLLTLSAQRGQRTKHRHSMLSKSGKAPAKNDTPNNETGAWLGARGHEEVKQARGS